MNDSSRTRDSTPDVDPESSGQPASPYLEILFHYDLRRIGERSAEGTFPPEIAVTVGRDSPRFAHAAANAGPLRGLGDRCVSREQLSARFRQSRRLEIEPNPAARLPVERLSLEGPSVFEEVDATVALPPGAIFAIGRRVLLRFGYGSPLPPEEDRLGMIRR